MRYVGLGICHLTFTLLITTQITFLREESMAHEHEIIQIYLSPSKCFVLCDLVKKKMLLLDLAFTIVTFFL